MISKTAGKNYVINNAVERHNMDRELAAWIFDGIGMDVVEGWSEDRFFRWVNYGERVYGFTHQHHVIINKLTEEYANFVLMATREERSKKYKWDL